MTPAGRPEVVVGSAILFVCLLSFACRTDPTLFMVDSFDDGAEGWRIYDYHGGIAGSRYPSYYHPVSWERAGGVGDSGFVWGDDSRWRVDTPEEPDSILPFIWSGPNPSRSAWTSSGPRRRYVVDLRDGELSVYLRGDGLSLKGAKVYFWVVNSPVGTRWHYTAHPFNVQEGNWGDKQTITLKNDERLWHRSWARDRARPGSLDEVLGRCNMYGFSFLGFSAEVEGRLAMDELTIRGRIVAGGP